MSMHVKWRDCTEIQGSGALKKTIENVTPGLSSFRDMPVEFHSALGYCVLSFK